MDEATHKLKLKQISIRDLFMHKNPSLARWIPGFVYRFLSRILRIDFMNDPILYHHGYKKNVDFAMASIEAFNVSLDVNGREHLPRETFDKRFSPLDWAQKVKDHVYSLPDQPEKEFDYIQN